ncbi:HNH endonuclease [Xanthobacter autotrophicus]|uniref:HNH endonuclease n=1 Tax=Xanthobacter autotrophicus TaxID=280 RepID=UPI00372A3EF3
MAARRHISTKARVQLFADHGGRCHICGGKIDGIHERWDVEHVIPLELGGADDPLNWAPAHVACHKAKTKKDAADIGRARRVHARHIGAKSPSRTPLPYGRKSKLKKKITGEVVPR